MKHYIYNIGIKLIFSFLLAGMCASKAHAGDDLRLHTIVIDAGHGGKDPGAPGRTRGMDEKDINLSVAKKLGKLINDNCPDIKVVFTRSTDVYLTLDERATIANRHKANLFLSIHVNSNDDKSANGFSCHILGQSSKKGSDTFASNFNVCKRENSVILLEDDYSTKYQGFDPSDPESFIFFNLMQNAFYEQSLNFAVMANRQMEKNGPIQKNRGISQDPFYVLWKTTMPAMLFEMAFISNASDWSVITSEEGQDKIAKALYEAFVQFKDDYNKSLSYNATTHSETTTNVDLPKEENSVKYGIQVATVGKIVPLNDPFFKGYEASRYEAGKMNKYIIVESDNLDDVEKIFELAGKKFSGSFIVKIENGQVTRFIK